MKTQNEMRGEFEKLEEVKNRLSQGGVYWDGKKYSTLPFMSSFVSTAIFLNGAWYAFQEQQKKIDDVLNLVCKLQYSSGERIYSEVKELLK